MKVTDFINGKVTYDNLGQYFWIDGKRGTQMLAMLRGWGHIQNMFRAHPIGKAEKFQDEVGEWIAAAINEKLEREKL